MKFVTRDPSLQKLCDHLNTGNGVRKARGRPTYVRPEKKVYSRKRKHKNAG